MVAIRAEIRAVEQGVADKADNPLKNAPHTVAECLAGEWTHPYSREQAAFPLPFDGLYKPECCAALKQNHGLYTQCQMGPSTDSEFCKGCQKQCDKNESGKPSNGTIQDRMSSEFKGPKGDAPKHYTAIMKKLKLTKEQVLEMELQMLQVLEFSITTPTSYRFLERFKKLAQVDDQTFFFAQYLQEVAMLDASLLKYKPSELAAACLILSA
jgi:hypothetical protein